MEMNQEGNMAPQRSWWSKNWKWAVPVGCLGLMASCCGATLVAGALGWNVITNNPASTRALEIAKADSEVQAVLGTPIQTSPLKQQNNVQYANGQSRAEAAIELDGPKADGVLRMEAVKSNDEWIYRVLQVEVPGQEPIDLMDKVGGPSRRELAPPTPDSDDTAPDIDEGQDEGQDDAKGTGKPDINL